MPQEDYLKKQFDKLGRALGKLLTDLLDLKSKSQISDKLEQTNHVFRTELTTDLENLIQLPTDSFVEKLKSTSGMSNENLERLADILLFHADNDHQKKIALYERCLAVYDYLEKTDSTYSFERRFKINRIKNTLA